MAMARLKFLVFAVVVLGVAVGHLWLVSPGWGQRAVEDGKTRAAVAGQAVAAGLLARRAEVQAAALGIATDAQALSTLQPYKALSEKKLADFRAALEPKLPSALGTGAVIALGSEAGRWAVRANGEAMDAEGLNWAQVGQAGAAGVVSEALGTLHLFHAIPLMAVEKGELIELGTLVIGAPALTDGLLADAAQRAQATGLALRAGGKLLGAAGPDATLAENLVAPGVVRRGEASVLGPLKLPLLTGGDVLGGRAPLRVGATSTLESLGDVAAVVDVSTSLGALADYQGTAAYALAGLLALTLLFTLVMGGGKSAQPAPPAPFLAPVANASATASVQAAAPAAEAPWASTAQGEPAAPALPLPELPAAPEASPDDFQFSPPPSPAPEGTGGQGFDPFQFPPASAPSGGGGAFDAAPEPSAESGMNGVEPPAPPPGPNPWDEEGNATRVAAVPAELLQAAAQTASPAEELVKPGLQALSAPLPAPAPSDDDHFQEVFRAFVSTREQCGEAADGLTFEKFALKLRKNKEQLVQKYACRTVRFQVYVKDGKAALKATPIRD
jgi:hypothetical protein